MKRTITNALISGFNRCRYAVTEPVQLRVARSRYEDRYGDPDEVPLVSVYTPTYNRAALLMERAVPSVLSQTYQHFEYIIVGDHCTDATEQIISQLKEPRIRFHNIPRRGYRYPPTAENHWLAGPVVAANTALDMVRGKWIARIDDDDIWTPDHIAALLKFAHRGDYEFVSSAYIAERYGRKALIDVRDQHPRIGGTQTWLYRSYLKFMRYNINCWRKSWNRVNDMDLQDRIWKAGARIGFLEKVTCHVLPRPGENTIGLEAYRSREEEMVQHYRFDEPK